MLCVCTYSLSGELFIFVVFTIVVTIIVVGVCINNCLLSQVGCVRRKERSKGRKGKQSKKIVERSLSLEADQL